MPTLNRRSYTLTEPVLPSLPQGAQSLALVCVCACARARVCARVCVRVRRDKKGQVMCYDLYLKYKQLHPRCIVLMQVWEAERHA